MNTSLECNATKGEQLSFLPPLEFSPMWPTENTLEDKALAMFATGKVFNHHEFEQTWGSWRLAAVVFNLRGLGWPIETMPTPTLCAATQTKTVARYRLPAKYIAMAMAAGATP